MLYLQQDMLQVDDFEGEAFTVSCRLALQQCPKGIGGPSLLSENLADILLAHFKLDDEPVICLSFADLDLTRIINKRFGDFLYKSFRHGYPPSAESIYGQEARK